MIWNGQMVGFIEHSVSEISDLIFSTVYFQSFICLTGLLFPFHNIHAKSIEIQQKTLFKVFRHITIYPLRLCMDL